MKICELKINRDSDRASLISILAFAGYKVSIKERPREGRFLYRHDYFVIVEDIKGEGDEPSSSSRDNDTWGDNAHDEY